MASFTARIYRFSAAQAERLGHPPSAGCLLVAWCEVCRREFTAVRLGIPADGSSVVEACRHCGAPSAGTARYMNTPAPPELRLIR